MTGGRMTNKTAFVAGLLGLILTASPSAAPAQDAPKTPEAKPAEPPEKKEPPKEESSATEHSIKIGGQTINYTATAGTILLKDDKDEATASIYYTAYTKSDAKDSSQRPLTFLYNGGPGSSSVWLHMGAFGPRRVMTTDAAPTPPPPYKLVDNASSLLDKTDMVFIDPVGTGFSKAVGKAKGKDFWGVDQDVKSLAEFITTYVGRNSRWNSPKYLLGESYGTFRSAALVNFLQSRRGMDFNGVVLVSNVLDLSTLTFPNGDDRPFIYYLPSYAATAWYHKVLKDRPADLNAFLLEARQFAVTEYAAALIKGAKLPAAEKADMAKKLSRFTGLSEDYLIKANLRVNLPQFRAELQRNRELATGRLDARFSGPSYDLLTEYVFHDPQSDAVTGAFTAAFNTYVRDELKFGRDKHYIVLSYEANRAWDWKHDTDGGGTFFPSAPNVEGDMAQAMLTNTNLQVQVENGIFDLATPFFASEYTMDHLGLPDKLQGHVHQDYYDAGHMMYVNEASLAKLKENVARFIDSTSHH
jgi:carboxypeptidase C (cathepsin A)